MEKAALIQQTSQELQGMFAKNFVPLRLTCGETLFEQGKFDDRLYVLDEGLLEVSVFAASGRKLSLNLLRCGSVFGEIAMFDPGPRTARVEALETCKLRTIQQSILIAEIVNAPHLAAELLSLAGKRMRWMSQQMENQVFLSSTARLATKMLYFADESGKIDMSQAQLADFVGVTREIVSKTLADWRRQGIVALSRGHIEICDGEALKSIKNSELLSLV